MALEIKTDNKYREILTWYDLTAAEQKEHKNNYDSVEESSFFRYKNWVHDLNDFMRIDNHHDLEFSKWHSYSSDSFFSGVLIKITDDGEAVIAATYYS